MGIKSKISQKIKNCQVGECQGKYSCTLLTITPGHQPQNNNGSKRGNNFTQNLPGSLLENFLKVAHEIILTWKMIVPRLKRVTGNLGVRLKSNGQKVPGKGLLTKVARKLVVGSL